MAHLGLAAKAEAIAFGGRIEELMSSICEPKDIRLLCSNICSPRILLNILLIRFFHRDICWFSRREIECACSGP